MELRTCFNAKLPLPEVLLIRTEFIFKRNKVWLPKWLGVCGVDCILYIKSLFDAVGIGKLLEVLKSETICKKMALGVNNNSDLYI